MRSIVKAPSLFKAANGLVEVGNRIDVGDDRWEDGVTFTPRGCITIFGHVPICTSEDKSNPADCRPAVIANAYLLEVALAWSTVDLGADPKEMLSEAMDIGTSPVLERLTWEGIADVAAATPINQPAISGTRATGGIVGRLMGAAVIPPTLTGSAVSAGTALAAPKAIGTLEAKLLDASDHTAGGGTIFMSPVVAATADTALCDYEGGRLVTRATRMPVIVGNFDADMVIGVNGEVDVYLGDTFVVEAHERKTNEWVGRAERRAIAVWNPCGVFSVGVT